MTNETTTAATEREMMNNLNAYVERQIGKYEENVKFRMEELTEDFNENFEYHAELIYKNNLILEFLKELRALLAEEERTIEGMRFQLRHAAEHAADDIMHRDPYSGSSNAAANLTHRWTYESYKAIRHLALNLLNRVTPDND